MAEIKWPLANSVEGIKSYRNLLALNKEEVAKELEYRWQIATKKAYVSDMSRPKNQPLYISTAQKTHLDDVFAHCEAFDRLHGYDPKEYFYIDEPELISVGKKPPPVEAEEVPDIDTEEWLTVLQNTIPHGSENIKE